MGAQLDYLAEHSKKSKAAVITAALIHAKQRASQNDHGEIEEAADDLLQRLDAKRQ